MKAPFIKREGSMNTPCKKCNELNKPCCDEHSGKIAEPQLIWNTVDDTVQGESLREWLKWNKQEREQERQKVLSEVLEMVKHQRLSQKDGYFTDERKRHQNSLRAELRAKLNQLKEGK